MYWTWNVGSVKSVSLVLWKLNGLNCFIRATRHCAGSVVRNFAVRLPELRRQLSAIGPFLLAGIRVTWRCTKRLLFEMLFWALFAMWQGTPLVDGTLAGFHEFWFTSSVQEIVLSSLPNIVRVIKSRRMRWAGHVAHEGGERRVQDFGGETWVKGATWETQA